ncbi:Calmodulin-binding transcription activator 6 [Triticum urartu]|uniref:Calmodulin-binding transcription activator 6 n=1 Tax=Triticum urartu TaxID=4572 RepID=M8A0G8_TRIUA|nr:Calmodulin-binding transcription activator 6 [Triticum urartu]
MTEGDDNDNRFRVGVGSGSGSAFGLDVWGRRWWDVKGSMDGVPRGRQSEVLLQVVPLRVLLQPALLERLLQGRLERDLIQQYSIQEVVPPTANTWGSSWRRPGHSRLTSVVPAGIFGALATPPAPVLAPSPEFVRPPRCSSSSGKVINAGFSRRLLLSTTVVPKFQYFPVSCAVSAADFGYQAPGGHDILNLQREVKTRWLKPREVLDILQNCGSWFLFNRRVHRFFRNDGYVWQKKKNGKSGNEAHEYLKVDNVKALNCYYARAENNPRFMRRIYWMLEPAYEHIVLVHYRDVLEGSISVSVLNGSPTSNQNGSASRADAHSSPGLTSEIVAPLLNSCSPGSAEEVSSQIPTINNETNDISLFDWRRTLEMQLSLENKERHDVNTDEVLPNHDPIPAHGIQNEELDACINLADVFDLGFREDNHAEGSHPYPDPIDVLKYSETWLEDDQLKSILHSAPVTIDENQWFHLHEVSPEWAFCSESAKVVIVGDFPCNLSNSSWVLFGDVKVPAVVVQQGVIRCYTPPYLGAGKMLFDSHGCELFSKFRLPLPNARSGFPVNPSEIIGRTCEQLDHENAVNCIMEVMLNNKFQDWLSSKFEQNSEGEYLLPKQYHGVIHTIAALGYDWALKPLLSNGVPINYRDANGWTALHWAARFGREQMVAVLVVAGAAVGALSDPTAEDPAAKTPASIASAYGFIGISAFLSEAQLTSTLDSLESKENGKPVDHNGGVSTSSAVDRVSDKCAHVDGGTDDQLALKDSLGAIRNAVQAAGRIQATFRVFSLKKKKQKALQNGDSSASPSMLERATLSIQKNFRCWKKSKEYQKIRKNVIKIQARFRAHRERNKYKELLQSVGILEKIMLRWFRKGVGLRGINSRAMPIDQDEEEDIVKVLETAVSEAVSRVSAIVGCPVARLDYRRMLEMHQQAKIGHGK